MRIYTNTTSLTAQNNLNRSQQSLGTAIERLSSGLRINGARDDAAGQAISNRMTSNLLGNYAAGRNVQDAKGLVNTALGGLDEINNNLQRIRELRVQYLNDTNSMADKGSIQAEIDQRLKEIERVSSSASFNGISLFRDDKSLNIQVGATAADAFDLDLQSISLASLGLKDARFGPIGSQYTLAGTTYDVSFGGIKFRDGTSLSVDEAAAYFGVSSNEIGVVNFKYPSTAFPEGYMDTPLLQVGDKYLSSFELEVDPITGGLTFYATQNLDNITYSDTESGINYVNMGRNPYWHYIGFDENDTLITHFELEGNTYKAYSAFYHASGPNKNTVNIAPVHSTSLGKIDAALEKINEYRSHLGAAANRLDSMTSTLEGESLSLEAARSRIMDADYALEISNLTRTQILQQAGQSVLAQANQIPNGMLSLLR